MGTSVRSLAGVAVAALLVAGCGEDDFANEPRAPVRVELTGVIQEDKVTVSPAKVGAGPILITISNQTERARTITLEGGQVREQVGPVRPLEAETITKTLEPGEYEVRAGSPRAVRREIEPAVLSIGRQRRASNDELLLP
ncbi:MAG TPA: hypothetical protein VEY90_12630 [Thermoleophilaceae bacterium]|nr:hypothetical protein [Thermoleophilaceae bacterium]